MFLLRTLVLAVTAGLLAGCAVGQDYHRPDAPLLKHYHSQPAVQQRSASRIASFDVWWEGFNNPMLSSLVSDALAQNLDLAQATAQIASMGMPADLLRRRPDIIVAERHLAASHARNRGTNEKNRRSGRGCVKRKTDRRILSGGNGRPGVSVPGKQRTGSKAGKKISLLDPGQSPGGH